MTGRGFGTGKGRQKGSPNKVKKLVAAEVIAAASRHGFDGKGRNEFEGYLDHLAVKHPELFAAMVRVVLKSQYAPKFHDHFQLTDDFDEDEICCTEEN